MLCEKSPPYHGKSFPWYIGIILFLLLVKQAPLLLCKGDLKGTCPFLVLIADTDIVSACL